MSKNDSGSDEEGIFEMDDLRKLDPKVFGEDALETPKPSIKQNKSGRFGVSPPPSGSLVGYYNEDKIGDMMKPLVINNPNKNYKTDLSSLKKSSRLLTPNNIKLEYTPEMIKEKKYYDRVKHIEGMLSSSSSSSSSSDEIAKKPKTFSSIQEKKRYKYQLKADDEWQKINQQKVLNRKNLRLQSFQRELENNIKSKKNKNRNVNNTPTMSSEGPVMMRDEMTGGRKRRKKTHKKRGGMKKAKKRDTSIEAVKARLTKFASNIDKTKKNIQSNTYKFNKLRTSPIIHLKDNHIGPLTKEEEALEREVNLVSPIEHNLIFKPLMKFTNKPVKIESKKKKGGKHRRRTRKKRKSKHNKMAKRKSRRRKGYGKTKRRRKKKRKTRRKGLKRIQIGCKTCKKGARRKRK